MRNTYGNRQSGMTLVELIAVVAILGIGLLVIAMFFRPMEGRLESAVAMTEAQLRQARATAMATTSAYRVHPDGPGRLIAETASSCGAATWLPDDDLDLTLPDDVQFSDTTWGFCFGSRGVSSTNGIIDLEHIGRETRRIEVLRGGTTRVLP